MEVRFEPARCDRPSRGLAVLARIPVAGRSAGPARVSDGPLSQVGALLARHAFAVGRALQRAPRAIRLFRDFDWCDIARRQHHARDRAASASVGLWLKTPLSTCRGSEWGNRLGS